MSAWNNGASAFPSVFKFEGPSFDPIKQKNIPAGQAELYVDWGMSLRDYFAAKVLQGLLADGIECNQDTAPTIAANAYLMADLMLAERAK